MRLITILASVLLLVITGCSKKSDIPQIQIETEHLRAVPVTSTTDQVEIDDMNFFRANGMDGGSVTIDNRRAGAHHNTNGSWSVKYADGTTENASMNPSGGAYRLLVRGKVVDFLRSK